MLLSLISTCLIFHRPCMNLYPDCFSAHLKTAMLWISTACLLHFPSCPFLLKSCLEKLPILVKYQDSTSLQAINTKQPYFKANRPFVNITDLTWTLPVKRGSRPVSNHRVGNISAGQAGNTYRQAVNTN